MCCVVGVIWLGISFNTGQGKQNLCHHYYTNCSSGVYHCIHILVKGIHIEFQPFHAIPRIARKSKGEGRGLGESLVPAFKK